MGRGQLSGPHDLSALPLYNPITLGQESNEFVLRKNTESIFSHPADSVRRIEESIAKVSQICYLRTGDMVAIELQELKPLCTRDEEKVHIDATFCDNQTIDFQIIF